MEFAKAKSPKLKRIEKDSSGLLTDRIEYIDILRVLSMFSVVFLHTAAGSLRGNYGSYTWHFSNTLTSIMSASVPIFFMISGALLLNSKSTLSVGYTLKKRLPRVLIPFLVWSLSAVAYYAIISFISSGSVDTAAALDRLKNLPSRATTVHLWFMYALIPLYVLSPLLKKFVDSLDKKLINYTLFIWVFFASVLPTIAAFIPESYRSLFVLNSAYNLNFMTGFAGFFIAGYFCMRYNGRIPIRYLITAVILDTILIALGTWWKTSAQANYSEMFKSYTRIFILVLSICLFLLFKELFRGRKLSAMASSLLQMFSQLSFGVYLVHNLLIDFLSRITDLWTTNSIAQIVVSYLVILLFSHIIVIILASIRPLCYIVTGMKFRDACNCCNLFYFMDLLVNRKQEKDGLTL